MRADLQVKDSSSRQAGRHTGRVIHRQVSLLRFLTAPAAVAARFMTQSWCRQTDLTEGATYNLKLEEAQSARAAGSATKLLMHLWKWGTS